MRKSVIPLSVASLVFTFSAQAKNQDGASSADSIGFHAPQIYAVDGALKLEAPSFFDYDKDGVTDIISGNYAGHVMFRKNLGTDAKPRYAKPIKLEHADGTLIAVHHW